MMKSRRWTATLLLLALATLTLGVATFGEAHEAKRSRLMRQENVDPRGTELAPATEDEEDAAAGGATQEDIHLDDDDEEGEKENAEEHEEEVEKTDDHASEVAIQMQRVAAKESRRKCPYWQQMGCLLDVMEKSCSPDEDGAGLIKKTSTESVWMCCCPTPYKSCRKAERDGVCSNAMNKHLGQLTSFVQRDFNSGVQKVRGEMRKVGGESCGVLAASEPTSKCGFEALPKVSRSMARADLFCEMLTWQLEELGDGNAAEFKTNGCPFREHDRQTNRLGDTRKGQRLLAHEV